MTITTREEFEEEDDGEGEGGDMGDHHDPSSAANYRDELLHDSPFPTNRSSRYKIINVVKSLRCLLMDGRQILVVNYQLIRQS